MTKTARDTGLVAPWVALGFGLFLLVSVAHSADPEIPKASPFVVVLGVAQDGGVPQSGSHQHPAWEHPSLRRRVVCLGLVDPVTKERWLIEATPDFRQQLKALDDTAPRLEPPVLDGIFLTHAHIGHYTGLVFLGHESMGAQGVPVYAMPRMSEFLSSHGPWEQLVRYRNIVLKPLQNQKPVQLNKRLRITPFLVPHRQEYSEVVGYKIEGPSRSILFIPDIDSWRELDETGKRIEDWIAEVDVAYLDATFYANGEIPGRDMSGFPHPFIVQSLERFALLPASELGKIRFLHFNHTNPALDSTSAARAHIDSAGVHVAEEGEVTPL